MLAVSDTHGNFDFLPLFAREISSTTNDLLIILGDCGINYSQDRADEWTKEFISKNEITLFCLRGNHDLRPEDVKDMIEVEYCGGRAYMEESFPNIIYAKDGEIYTINNKRFLTIGGAYSIDKEYRLMFHKAWFENEQLSDTERAQILRKVNGEKVDYFLAHTCPYEYQPTHLFLDMVEQSTVDKTMEHWLSEVEKVVEYNHLYFGHFHGDCTINDKVDLLFNKIVELNI